MITKYDNTGTVKYDTNLDVPPDIAMEMALVGIIPTIDNSYKIGRRFKLDGLPFRITAKASKEEFVRAFNGAGLGPIDESSFICTDPQVVFFRIEPDPKEA